MNFAWSYQNIFHIVLWPLNLCFLLFIMYMDVKRDLEGNTNIEI